MTPLNILTTFMTISYGTAVHSSGTAHYFNDTEFFNEFYSLVLEKTADAVDVGFNIGMQTELILPLTSGRVFGFEASKKIYDFAKDKFTGNHRVELFNCAVSDSEGTASFIDTECWGAGSLRHTAGMDHIGMGDAYSVIEVQLARLDSILSDQNNIGLIKLDIEGAEFSALEGARELIERNRPFMVMELAHNALSFDFRGKPITRDTLYEYARELRYKVYNIYGICLSNPKVWQTSVLKDTADVYLIPDEQHERWTTELLPVYQYLILTKILEAIEWDSRGPAFFALTALPDRIYKGISASDEKVSKEFLTAVQTRLRSKLGGRNEIYETGYLSGPRANLLALVYDGDLDGAYRTALELDSRGA